MFRPSSIVTAASAYLLDGVMTPAVERMVETSVASVRALGNLPTTVRSISTLAQLHLLQGRLRQAAATIERLTQLVQKREELYTLLNGADYYFLMGDLLREEWNQLSRAEQYLVQGMELVRETMSADARITMRGYLALSPLPSTSPPSPLQHPARATFLQSTSPAHCAPSHAHDEAARADSPLKYPGSGTFPLMTIPRRRARR
jgi:hypothetical protein